MNAPSVSMLEMLRTLQILFDATLSSGRRSWTLFRTRRCIVSRCFGNIPKQAAPLSGTYDPNVVCRVRMGWCHSRAPKPSGRGITRTLPLRSGIWWGARYCGGFSPTCSSVPRLWSISSREQIGSPMSGIQSFLGDQPGVGTSLVTLDVALLNDADRAVIVAMVAVRMVQMSVDQIVDVIAVGHGRVAAAGTMQVSRLMSAALMIGRATVGIGCAHVEAVFVDVVAMRMVQMTVVQVVDVVAMPDCRMPAVRTVLVIVMGVMRFVAGAHGLLRQDDAGSVCSAA